MTETEHTNDKHLVTFFHWCEQLTVRANFALPHQLADEIDEWSFDDGIQHEENATSTFLDACQRDQNPNLNEEGYGDENEKILDFYNDQEQEVIASLRDLSATRDRLTLIYEHEEEEDEAYASML